MRISLPVQVSVAVLLLFATCVSGQEITGAITGFVRDASGAAIPGAEVKAIQTSTGFVRTTVTASDGGYVLPSLPIGDYQIECRMQGFKAYSRKGLVLHVNDRLAVDIPLEVGSLTEEVTVSAAASAVQTENSEVSGLADENMVREMPLNGRSFLQLTTLFPGTVAGAAGQGKGPAAFSDPTNPYFGKEAMVSVNGARAQQTNWVIDGANNVDPGANWTVNNMPTPDSIAEFRILESDYTAEFGRSAGGQVNIITRSGGAAYHGTLLEFFRNDKLDARPFFADSKGPLRFNQFGFNVGGPVIPTQRWKEKLSFFVSEEWVRAVTSTPFVGNTITAAERTGDFSELLSGPNPVQLVVPGTTTPLPGNQIPAAYLDANAQRLLALYPRPTRAGLANNYVTNISGYRNSLQQMYRLDYRITPATTFTARWLRDGVETAAGNGVFSGGGLPGNGTKLTWPGENLVGSLVHVFSPTLLNEVQVSRTYARLNNVPTGLYLRSQVAGLSIPEMFPLSGKTDSAGNLPQLNISGISPADNVSGLPYRNYTDAVQFDEKLSYIRGSHTFKTGFHYVYGRKREAEVLAPEEGSFTFNGFATGSPVADFLIGQAYTYTEQDSLLWGEGRYQDIEAFFQDHIKAGQHLTLDLGVRLELFPTPWEASNRFWNFYPELWDRSKAPIVMANGFIAPGTGDLWNGIIKAPYQGSRSTMDNHYNTWSPRFGFAWSPGKDAKTVVRGGYGLYYDRGTLISQFGYANAQTVGVLFIPQLSNPSGGINLTLPRVVVANDRQAKIGSVQQWSFGIQREIVPQTVFDVRYVGSVGRHLQNTIDLNQPYPNAEVPLGLAAEDSIRPYPGFGMIGYIRNSGNSSYHSLQTSVSRRVARGLTFQLSYTWSKAIDDSPFHPNIINGVQDMRNQAAERALSDTDAPHNFVYSYVWNIPWLAGNRGLAGKLFGGWEMSGIVRFQSGQPFNVTLPSEVSGTGTLERANLVANPNLSSGDRTVERYFNTDAFVLPAVGTFGNSARNVVRGPGINNWDWAMQKNGHLPWFGGSLLGEKAIVQFRFEMFNMWNHSQFWAMNTVYGTPGFGSINSARAPRQLQLGLKLLW